MDKIREDLNQKKNERIGAMEAKIKQLRDSGKATDKNQQELGDLLVEYGKLVKQVEKEMLAEQQEQANKLEVELAARRKKRQLEAEKKRKEKEAEENAKVQEQEAMLKAQMDGIKQLIKPVQNENKRLDALLQDPSAKADL